MQLPMGERTAVGGGGEGRRRVRQDAFWHAPALGEGQRGQHWAQEGLAGVALQVEFQQYGQAAWHGLAQGCCLFRGTAGFLGGQEVVDVESRSEELAPLESIVGVGQTAMAALFGEPCGDGLRECVAGSSPGAVGIWAAFGRQEPLDVRGEAPADGFRLGCAEVRAGALVAGDGQEAAGPQIIACADQQTQPVSRSLCPLREWQQNSRGANQPAPSSAPGGRSAASAARHMTVTAAISDSVAGLPARRLPELSMRQAIAAALQLCAAWLADHVETVAACMTGPATHRAVCAGPVDGVLQQAAQRAGRRLPRRPPPPGFRRR
ncbi:hypothetical protein ACFYWY_29435 [Streptomyces sp. NPDC002870]|uniref:hypothetical protein n=1 Tax=Streptomyces sp. NPDC002870 TaxID=3364666 RepID=UPI0036775114